MKYAVTLRAEDRELAECIYKYGSFLISGEFDKPDAFDFIGANLGEWHLSREHAKGRYVSNEFLTRVALTGIFGKVSRGVASGILAHIINKLSEWKIVTYLYTDKYNPDGVYQFNKGIMDILWYWDFYENILLNDIKLIEKYKNSVPYIAVTDIESQDESIGTGFFVSAADGSFSHIVTNRHVIEGKNISEIRSADGGSFQFGQGVVSSEVDLGAVPILDPPRIPRFRLGDTRLLESVVTLGYPTVAYSVENVLLAHRGEINGNVRLRDENGRISEMLAISCHVAPGNSGGPVIDASGRIIGVVSQSVSRMQTDRRTGDGTVVSTHHMAVSARDLAKFLGAQCGLSTSDLLR